MSVCCLLFLWPSRGWRSIGDFVLTVLLLEQALKLFDDTFRFFSGVKKADGDQPLGNAEEITAWFKRSKIYPVVHCLQLRADCLVEHKGLAEALLDAFKRAWAESEKRLDEREKELIKNKRELLGFDAYKYELGEVQTHTIEKLMDYLQADGLLKGRFSLKDIFPN